jgi:hypothetical protein
MSQPFWGYDINILWFNHNWSKVIPTKYMNINEQYNSITRIVIYTSLLFF